MPSSSHSYEDEGERRERVIALRDAIAAGIDAVDLDALAERLVAVEREWLQTVIVDDARRAARRQD